MRWRIAAVLLSIAAIIAVVSTYGVFSQTYDEPAHIASGMEWLSRGTYTYDGAQHPPLTRILAALGPYSRGARTIGKINEIYEGDLILGTGAEYRVRLALARLGELPFLILLCVAGWLWGRRLLGEAGGALTLLFIVTNPNILAHAGLATTDIGLTATMMMALYAYLKWTDKRTLTNAIWFGGWMTIATLTKFSAMPFIGLTLLFAELWRVRVVRSKGERWGFPASQLGVAVVVGLVVLWAAYRFDFHPVLRGLGVFLGHGTSGHPAFLLGETSNTGWWYYFPVALAVKTPLPLMLFGIVGAAATVASMRREEFEPALPLCVVVAVLAVGMAVSVDIGIRHILPLYPFVAVLAARGVIELYTRADSTRFVKGVTATVAASAVLVAVRAHPDHLAYFNPLAGANPDRILVDSNLDWGQDLYRLSEVVQRLHIDTIHVAYFGSADMQAAGVPNAFRLEANQRATGWVAASRTNLAGVFVGPAYSWLFKEKVVGTVGPSLILFHVGDPK